MGFPEPTSSEWLLGSACADMEAGEGIFVDSADAAGNTVAACCSCLDVAMVSCPRHSDRSVLTATEARAGVLLERHI